MTSARCAWAGPAAAGRETLRVVEVFVARQAAVHRLPQEIGQPELRVPSVASVVQVRGDQHAVVVGTDYRRRLRESPPKVARLLRERFGLSVTASTVTRALHRTARQRVVSQATAVAVTAAAGTLSHR